MMNDPEILKKHPMAILVDDSSIDNFVNKKILERYGFANEVISFTRAQKALKYLMSHCSENQQYIPTLIFLDLNMPEMDGHEFLDAFKLLPDKIRKNTDIVILTSSINPTDVVVCGKHEKVVTFLHKPLLKSDLEELKRALIKKNQKLEVFKMG